MKTYTSIRSEDTYRKRELREEAEWFACNPGANTSHLRFRTKQLINNFLPAEGHKPEIIML